MRTVTYVNQIVYICNNYFVVVVAFVYVLSILGGTCMLLLVMFSCSLCNQGKTRQSLAQWRSQAGAHWGTCPSNWRLCPTSAGAPERIIGAECTVINRELGAKSGTKVLKSSCAI